ncbi:MAG: phosphate ABC transporter substrate-binding/OmpA family protein [Pseudomonadota bacterium]
MRLGILALHFLLCSISLACADDRVVRLTAPDGGLEIEGELLSVDGEFFRLQTEFGPVTLDAGGMACAGAACPSPEDSVVGVTLAGPTDLLDGLLRPIMTGFARDRGWSFVEAPDGPKTTTWTLIDPLDGRDIAVWTVGRNVPKPDLVVSRLSTPPELFGDVIALDAMVLLVAPDNPVATLSTRTLRLMLEGRLDRWPEVLTGIADAAAPDINLHLPTDLTFFGRIWPYAPVAPSARAVFYDDALGGLSDAVADDPGAVGVAPISQLGGATPLVMAGPCGRVFPATPFRIKAEDYPLTQPIYIERLTAFPPRVVRDFIGFAQSEKAQEIIRRTGLIDQSIARLPFSRQSARLANAVSSGGDDAVAQAQVARMIRTLARADRLSLSFRFEDGQAALDATSRSNVRQLAEAIEDGAFEDEELLFVGFTDGLGPAEANLRLSRQRAETVAEAVKQALTGSPQRILTDGFGESLPMACDDAHWGREINRRVEVWSRPRADAAPLPD